MSKSVLNLKIINELSYINAENNNKKLQTSILDLIFSFKFCHRITCSSCNCKSDTIADMNTLPVDVENTKKVEIGMSKFFGEEILEGINAYECLMCQKKTRATTKLSILTEPNILVIHLKRFNNSNLDKLSHYVSYPETLSLKPFLGEPSVLQQQQQNPTENEAHDNFNRNTKALRYVFYKLYGVLVHLGDTSHSGHYYSYVRGRGDVWYKADDLQVNSLFFVLF